VPPFSVVRALLFVCAAAAWASWRFTVGGDVAPNVSFALWAATLLLFAAATFRPWSWPKPDGLTAAVAVLIAAAMLPRMLGLDFAPYEVTLDEAIHPVLGAEVLRDEPWRIFDGVSGHFATPYLDLVLQALLPGIWGARLVSAMLSALSLVTTYCLASRLYDRRTGAFATLVLACAYWHAAYARTGYPFMQVILIPTLALWPLARGLREDNSFLLYIGGILLGVSGLLYTSGRIVVPVFLSWWAIGALAGWFRARSMVPVALGLAVFLSPHVHRNGGAIFFSRLLETTAGEHTPLGALTAHGLFSDAARDLILKQARTAWRVYVDGGGWMAPHSEAPGPLLDTVTLVLVLLGLLVCLARMRRPASLLLGLWIGLTFTGGQVMTDVPQSAYRAAPMLPALAIAAAVAIESFASAASWLFGRRGARLRVFLALALFACIAPVNWSALDLFLKRRVVDPIAAMAHVVAAGDARLTYFVVGTESMVADPRFALVAGDKDVHDVPSLADLVGANLAAAAPRRTGGALIVLAPPLRGAESVVRRCYPGAISLHWPQWTGLQPAVGLWLRPEVIALGRGCELRSSDERGLRATYYEDENFGGALVNTRFEDWPMRWFGTEGPANFGSIEWNGFLDIPLAGTYVFSLSGNAAGSSAEIGRHVLLAAGGAARAQLKKRIYRVRLRYRAQPGTTYALMWEPPGGRTEVVPPELFSPYPRNRSDLRWVE
jgi:hypothetical protein